MTPADEERPARRRSSRGPNDASSPGSRVKVAATLISGIRRPPTPIERMNGTGTATIATRPIATVVPETTIA